MTQYVLSQGTDAIKRLALLSAAKWPSTKALFSQIGLRPGLVCMDVGCGSGEVALEMAKIVGPSGRVLGIDIDEIALAHARTCAALRKLPATFQALNLDTDTLARPFDIVYARFVLTHMQAPLALVNQMRDSAAPSGMIVVEDIDFAGHICHPHCRAFERYVELYEEMVRRRKGDARIGPRLPQMFEDAGLRDVSFEVVTPTFRAGNEKLVAAVTLEHIKPSILRAGIAGEREVDSLIAELTEFAHRRDTLISLARVFQVWGRHP